jgi:N-methylhydantoinase B
VALHRFGNEKETHFPNGKAFNQVLKPGDAYILRSGGGGGFGSPLVRDLYMLDRDVRCGYVSRESAENIYGAVFGPGGDIDRNATAARREKMFKLGLPVDQPISETHALPQHSHEHAHPPEETLTEEERVALAMTCRCCS